MTNNKSLISIVVPVYNVANRIAYCIDSLIKQTYSNIEILLIDDGSKDNSLEICNKYAGIDKRINVYTQKNSGPSVARNRGIELAKGEYIGFVDSDDVIELNMYELMLNEILQMKAQIAISDVKSCIGDRVVYDTYCNVKQNVFKKEEFLEIFFENPLLSFSVCNKLFEADTIGNTRFDTTIKMSEDQKFVYDVLKKTQKIVYLQEPLYSYTIVPTSDSLTRSKYTRYHLALLDVNEYIYDDTSSDIVKNKACLYNASICLNQFVPTYRNGEFDETDIKRVNMIIKNNSSLVLREGNIKMKIKMLLYMISPDLLSLLINKMK